MPSASVLGALAALAVACTALAYVLYFALIAEAGAVRATVITYLNPAVAVLASFALILAGSFLATRPVPPRPGTPGPARQALPAGRPGPTRPARAYAADRE
jgi:drug/metabolite transporter (DMT)-like permease